MPFTRPRPRVAAKLEEAMAPRLKKFLGIIILLPALAVYFLLAAALGVHIPDNQLLKAGYYLVAGVLWAFPAKSLIKWMNAERPRKDSADTS